MKSIIKTLAATAAITAAIGLSPVPSRAFMGDEMPGNMGSHMKQMGKELGLSPQQQQQIKDIVQKNRLRHEPLMQQLRAERKALRTVIQADILDETAIRAQAARIAAIQADLAVERAHMGQEIRKILTPEQVQKFRELQARRDQRMDEMKMNHPGRRLHGQGK